MAKLIIKFKNEVVDRIELKQGDMKIGRKPGNDIQIDNLAVSGVHANLFTIGEDTFIEDLQSTNGTMVNNRSITKHHLHGGDVISIGKHELVYATGGEDESVVPTHDFTKTVIIGPEGLPGAAPAAAKAPADTSGKHGAIFVLNGANNGKRIELTKLTTSLGKAGSKQGAINKTAKGFVITPVVGGDGTPILNGRPVPADGTLLKNGDIIEVAGTRLQFYYK